NRTEIKASEAAALTPKTSRGPLFFRGRVRETGPAAATRSGDGSPTALVSPRTMSAAECDARASRRGLYKLCNYNDLQQTLQAPGQGWRGRERSASFRHLRLAPHFNH